MKFTDFSKSKNADSITAKAPAPRNFVAKNMIQGGAGPMKDKSKTLARKQKHKNKDTFDE